MITPVLITGLICLMLGLGAGILGGRWLRSPAFGLGLGLALPALGFLPLLFVVGPVVDHFRYGTFTYASATEVDIPHVDLPPNATDIMLHRYSSGHLLTFSTDEPELIDWLQSVTASRRRWTDATPFARDHDLESRNRESIESAWRHDIWLEAWQPPEGPLHFYEGWRAANGGGFDVWFAPDQNRAWLREGYW